MRTLSSLAVATLLAGACLASPPVVTSTHDPALPVEILPARELWRLSDDDDEILGQIGDVTTDAEGNALLLDLSFNTVRIVDADGRSVGTVGREGDGPGEFRNPDQVLALPDGRIGVTQIIPGKIITLHRDGTPGEPVAVPGGGSMVLLSDATCAAGAIQICANLLTRGDGGVGNLTRLQSVDLRGEPIAVLKESSQDTEERGGAVAVRRGDADFDHHWAADADGRVYVAPYDDEYLIEVLAADGAPERVITVDYERQKRTREEIAAIEEERDGIQAHGVQVQLPPIDPYLRDVDQLYPRPDGTLWVVSSRATRDRPDGTVGAFDVFDASGRFVRRVAIAADFDPRYDEFVLEGDRLYVLKEALSAPASSPTSAGSGGMMVMRLGSSRAAGDDDRGPMPYEVVCYGI
ncbi:MAG: hypothetical protein R3D98_01770 [Candidatus Krumholzibacteriia bacterium]